MNGVGICIKVIAILNVFFGVLLSAYYEDFRLILIAFLVTVFIFGFGEVVCILSDIRGCLTSMNRTPQRQVEKIQEVKDNVEVEISEQMADIATIAIQTGLSFKEVEKMMNESK